MTFCQILSLGCIAAIMLGCGDSSQSPPPTANNAAQTAIEPPGPANALMVISPYKYEGMWVFDDASKGLDKEPFVSGVDVMIDEVVKDIPDAQNGFTLIFSAQPFPGHQMKFDRVEEEGGGYWYRSEQLELKGWLCPALFRYFDAAPEHIYAQVEPRESPT